MKFSNAQVGGISNNCVVRIVISVASTSTTPVPKAAVIFISVPGLNVPDLSLLSIRRDLVGEESTSPKGM